VIAFVSHNFFNHQTARIRRHTPVIPDFAQRFGRTGQSSRQRRRVALIGRMNLGRHNRSRLQINGVLGLVGQMGATVLHLGDFRVRVVGVVPLVVAALLALPLTVQTGQVLRTRRLDPRGLGQSGQEFAIRLTRIPPHDRAHGGVSCHGRGVHAQSLTFDQFMLSQTLEHPIEDGLVSVQVDPLPCPRQRGVIRSIGWRLQPQEGP